MNRDEQRKRMGQRIAALRKTIEWTDEQGIRRNGMTQTELGERCGLKQASIARIENGYFSAGFDQLQAIAEGLGKNIDIV
jgi:transcriptional regulator with XRE-family HTH domain